MIIGGEGFVALALCQEIFSPQVNKSAQHPVEDSSTTSFAGDTRDGWQLRGVQGS